MAKNTYHLACLFLVLFVWGSHSYGADLKTPKTQEFYRERLQEIYIAETGVRETEGNNRGPRIREYMATVGLSDGYAWCSGFVKWVFKQAGIPTPGTNGWAASWFPKDKVIWQNKPGRQNTVTPKTGDLFSIYYASLGRIGHVGIVDHYGGDYILTSEGNTNGAGSRDGDVVARKRRSIRQIHSIADWVTPFLKSR